jgi:hypothetical protein
MGCDDAMSDALSRRVRDFGDPEKNGALATVPTNFLREVAFELDERLKEVGRLGAQVVTILARRCRTCEDFWAYARPDAKKPCKSTHGDCHAKGLRGRLNNISPDFGCAIWRKKTR